MLDPGKYRGRPVSAALGFTSTGKEQVAVTFELVDPVGERITWYGFFTERTTDRTLQSLRSCGWRGNDLAVFVEGEPLPEGFDQEVELDVQHEEYQGKVTAKVAWVNSGGGLGLKNALTMEQARGFADRMKRQIDALDRATGRTAPASRPAPAPRRAAPPPRREEPPLELLEEQAAGMPGDDDVPF